MELEDLLSDELLEWLGNDEPDVSDDTDIEQLLAAASDVYEQSQSTGSTPQPDIHHAVQNLLYIIHL